jgi:hypothetical protein
VYQRHDFLPEKQRALVLRADRIIALVEDRENNVVPLRQAGG